MPLAPAPAVGWIPGTRPGMTRRAGCDVGPHNDSRCFRHSRRHQPADRRLHVRPAGAGTAAAIRRAGAAPGAAGLVSRSEFRRPGRNGANSCRRAGANCACGRWPCLWGFAGGPHRARARADHRPRAPSVGHGGGAVRSRVRSNCCRWKRRRSRLPNASSSRARLRPARCAPSLGSRRARLSWPSPAPIPHNARGGRPDRCSS